MTIYIDFHALQTLPPSNINRDDTGAPKSATFGGVLRQRVSSQAWKHAMREQFKSLLPSDQLGSRTRRVGQLIIEKALESIPEGDRESAIPELEKALVASFSQLKWKLEKPKTKDDEAEGYPYVRSSYLAFFSARQIEQLAAALVALNPGEKIDKKQLSTLLDTNHSVDISLFGRMIADAPDFNVDAASQVAHAISVHEAISDHDYFTAVDDVIEGGEETGAGMIGTIEFTSSTLYRYATINFDGLAKNLGDELAAEQASIAFAKAFVESQPTGKQNTFANQTLPELVLVTVRKDRPISYVNAFESPIEEATGRRVAAAKRLVEEASAIEADYGYRPFKTLVLGIDECKKIGSTLGEAIAIPELEAKLSEVIQSVKDAS